MTSGFNNYSFKTTRPLQNIIHYHIFYVCDIQWKMPVRTARVRMVVSVKTLLVVSGVDVPMVLLDRPVDEVSIAGQYGRPDE